MPHMYFRYEKQENPSNAKSSGDVKTQFLVCLPTNYLLDYSHKAKG